ncbi:hypothetical protein [Lactococcus lactis]|uniref:hypothetical protein n=1 Tax=Lactococcus lactis TaxID=1358 RepID=UPI0004E289CF
MKKNSKTISIALSILAIILGLFFMPKPVINSAIDKVVKAIPEVFTMSLLNILGYFLFSLGLSWIYITALKKNKSFQSSFNTKDGFVLFFFTIVLVAVLYCLINVTVDRLNVVSIVLVAIFAIIRFSLFLFNKKIK